MSMFNAYTAVRGTAAERVAETIEAYCRQHGMGHQRGGPDSPPERSLFIVSVPGFAVVLCPPFFPPYHAPLAAFLSSGLGALISAVNTWDEYGWEHLVFDRGQRLDRFCNNPDDEALGNPHTLAAAFGVSAQSVAPYCVPAEEDDGKAFPDDRFELSESDWVFVDLWRRLGISYPPNWTAGNVIVLEEDWLGTRRGAACAFPSDV